MKILDKFLKVLKTDRNTFFTYLLTLVTAYILIDRIVELLFMCFTGMSVSYWGPIRYTLAMACPVFAFAFSYPSKFAKSDDSKISFFYVYCVALYIIVITMFVQWINHLGWLVLLSMPNYETIFLEFSNLIKPAFTALSLYLPIVTFYKLFFWLYKVINDPIFPNNFKDSITDFQGIDLSPEPANSGEYSFELTFCKDKTTGKPVKIIENRRFDTTLIVGPSGTGKSALLMEPMMAKDLEKKYFFTELSKEMGYTALKTGIASLECPYTKEYLNAHFNLNMLSPVSGKEKVYKTYMNKMIYATAPDGKIVYKNLGLTSVTPDLEQTTRMVEVAKNLNLPYNLIDPFDPNSIGLNPFILQSPSLCGLIISLVIKGLYGATSLSAELAYMEDVALQATQNLAMLLKVMFPRLNDGVMPTLEDMLKCFNNFDYVESLCEEMKQIPELAEEYALQIGYFEQHFYKNSGGRENMKRYIHFASSQLDVLLRAASVRNIICNRYNNIDFNKILENGELTFLCTRAVDIGGTAHKGFGRFFLLLMMCWIEGRPGNEKSRIPHFLYVDDFDTYASPALSDMFTVYRKFKVGCVLAIPNLASLGGSNSAFMQTLLSNCSSKMTFGNNTPEDYKWWADEFGERREWKISTNYDTTDPLYKSNLGGVEWTYKDIMRVAKIQGLKSKGIIYKVKDIKGKNVVNFGNVDFLESKYKEPHKSKKYDFDKFNSGHIEETETEETTNKKTKFNPSHINFGSLHGEDVDPIVTDTTDSKYLFDNEDAISFNLKKDN